MRGNDVPEAVGKAASTREGISGKLQPEIDNEVDEEFIKISANLPSSVVTTLRQVAKFRGTSMTEVLRHAISLEKFLIDNQQDGGKLLIEKKDKSLIQVLIA